MLIEHRWAAMADSTATNTPPHAPVPDNPPSNRGTIIQGSATVLINRRAAARDGDTAETCNDPADLPVGKVVAVRHGHRGRGDRAHRRSERVQNAAVGMAVVLQERDGPRHTASLGRTLHEAGARAPASQKDRRPVDFTERWEGGLRI